MGKISPSALGFAFLFVALINSATWHVMFRRNPEVIAKKISMSELRVFDEKVVMIRTDIESKEAEKKSLVERRSIGRDKNEKELNAMRSEEQKELNGVQTTFQLEKNSISNRRRSLMQQETDALQKISSTLGSQLGGLNRQLSELGQNEATELARNLASLQQQFLMNYLREWHIDDAKVEGIGPGFKNRLRMAGILSAADIDNPIYTVNGIGAARSSALFAWQAAHKVKATQKMPKTLSLAYTTAVTAKYENLRQSLTSQKDATEQAVSTAQSGVRARYKGLLEPLEKEELLAIRKMQVAKESIEGKYRGRYDPLAETYNKLDQNLKRSIVEVEEKSTRERRNLFALNWQREKSRRRTSTFNDIRFSKYVKRIIGL